MKKIIVSMVLFGVVLFAANAQSFYLETEIGFGRNVETTINEERFDAYSDEVAVELGVRLGLASFYIEHMPVYMTLSLGSLGHRFFEGDEYFQFNSYLIGAGFVAYPFTFIQIAGSFGYSFVANDTSDVCCEPYKSEFGLGYDISAALKLGSSPSGLLIGVKYMWLTNILETSGAQQVSSGIFVFAKYTIRTVPRSSNNNNNRR
jgi:hypothetical protein